MKRAYEIGDLHNILKKDIKISKGIEYLPVSSIKETAYTSIVESEHYIKKYCCGILCGILELDQREPIYNQKYKHHKYYYRYQIRKEGNDDIFLEVYRLEPDMEDEILSDLEDVYGHDDFDITYKRKVSEPEPEKQ